MDRHIVDMSVFKARLCQAMRAVEAGEAEFVITRYRKQIALVRSLDTIRLQKEAEKGAAEYNAYCAAVRRCRIAQRRILIRARLEWPPEKAALLRCHRVEKWERREC